MKWLIMAIMGGAAAFILWNFGAFVVAVWKLWRDK